MADKQKLEQEDAEKKYEEERRRNEQESEKEKKEEIRVITAKEKQKATYKEIIEIPIVDLEKPRIEIKIIKFDKYIPEIKKKEIKIKNPLIELQKPRVELKQFEFDSTLPKIQTKESKLELPLIKLNKHIEIKCIINAFDERLPHFRKIERILRIPIYRVSKVTVKEIISSFDSRIDAKILQCLMNDELKGKNRAGKILTVVEKAETTSPESDPPVDEKEFEEIPDFIDFMFGASNNKVSSSGPKIVLYKELEEDSTIGSFETLCIRIYREKEGGNPRIQPIKKLDEFNIKEIEKWVEANKRVVTIDLDDDKEKTYQWFCEKNLREPLRRAIIGDVGFIIFKTRDANLYEYYKKVMENLEKEIEHPLDIVYAHPKPLSFEEKKRLSNLAWGNPNFDSISPILMEKEGVERPYGATFDDIFNKFSQIEFKKCLERLESSPYSNATKPHEGEESKEHKKMKWFVVKYLTKKLREGGALKLKNPKEPKAFEINELIKTEEDTRDKLNHKAADVMDAHNYEVYEVETLFAQDRDGKTVEEKLNYTINKYKELNEIKKINIILDNLTLLRNLKTVNKIKENKPKEERERVEFYTIDIQNDKLILLRDVIKKVKQLS